MTKNQIKTYQLWEILADRYKDNSCIAGYDLLNESVTDNVKLLNQLYHQLIKTIRAIDQNHILFIEGNKWATDISCLDEFADDNYVLSIHSYEPLDFTFNFIPHLRYPFNQKGRICNKDTLRQHLDQYKIVADKRNVPVFVGEFGVNTREGLYGEHQWVEDKLDHFEQYGFHWTYWTYKSIKNNAFPDGLYSYKENPPWVNRLGPDMGWDTFHKHWPNKKEDMIESWSTKNFSENKYLIQILQKYLSPTG